MISIYLKSGVIKKQSAICMILKSQKFKWTKAYKIDDKFLPDNSYSKSIVIDSIAALYSLKHIKDKHRKKNIIIYTDSKNIHGFIKLKNSKIEAVDRVVDFKNSFNNVVIKKLNKKCEFKDELEHLFIECALDDIEVDEKEFDK